MYTRTTCVYYTSTCVHTPKNNIKKKCWSNFFKKDLPASPPRLDIVQLLCRCNFCLFIPAPTPPQHTSLTPVLPHLHLLSFPRIPPMNCLVRAQRHQHKTIDEKYSPGHGHQQHPCHRIVAVLGVFFSSIQCQCKSTQHGEKQPNRHKQTGKIGKGMLVRCCF